MRQLPLLFALAAAPALEAQTAEPRSASYLFTSSVEDARALWVNPAGLGILPIASLYAEATADQPSGDSWTLRQYSFGIHSRSFGVSYQRDRILGAGSHGTWRIGAALPLAPRMAIGAAVTFSKPQRSLDAGLRFSPVRMLDLGLVVRNVGHPDVQGVEQPAIVMGGLAWYLARGRVGFQGDVIAQQRHPAPGYDRSYRAGAQFIIPAGQPLTILTALDFADDFSLRRWNVGIGIGYQAQAIAVGSALSDGGASARLHSVSITGVARASTQRRR